MVVSEVVGVGIFLTPATMMRSLGTLAAALLVWLVMGMLSAAGALCFAELTTRFPKAGGGYVFLREAYGARTAFVFGWMVLLVMDPGLTAALAIGFSQYAVATLGMPANGVTPTAVGVTVLFGALTLAGLRVSAAVMRWTAIAKVVIVAILAIAAFIAGDATAAVSDNSRFLDIGAAALAPSFVAAFFAFGGWWELGRMSEEVEAPRRTMPRALLGGLAAVTGIYMVVTLSFVLVAGGQPMPAADDAFVATIGSALFGPSGGLVLAAGVLIAVAGSLAAVLLGGPRLYIAMARDGLFFQRLVRFQPQRHTAPAATIIQVTLACAFVTLGTFEQILGYFVPVTVFFLGLAAAAVLLLPRPADDGRVFIMPGHPVPVALFLMLIVVMLALFVLGQPRQALLGAAVTLLGLPVSWLVVRQRRNRDAGT